jgi:excisionase family DNA binding protein
MLIVSPSTAHALAPHAAEHSWVMFVQVNTPDGALGPILIEGVRGSKIAERLNQLARDNAFDAMLIGLMETTTPDEHAAQIAAQCEAAHLHDHWYAPTTELLAFVQHVGQRAMVELLELAHPGALGTAPVDIDEMARILGVSVVTVRRMIKANEIPFLKAGRIYRFIPADVIASIQRR